MILALAGLTFIDVLVRAAPAAALLPAAVHAGRRPQGFCSARRFWRGAVGTARRRIAHARLTIASGLLLLAIATQILAIEHLP